MTARTSGVPVCRIARRQQRRAHRRLHVGALVVADDSALVARRVDEDAAAVRVEEHRLCSPDRRRPFVLDKQSRLSQHGIRIPEPAVAFDAVVGADDQCRVGHQTPNRRDVVVRAAAEHLLVDRPDFLRQRRVVAGCVGVQHADERVARDVHVRDVQHQQIPWLAGGIADRAIEVLLVGGVEVIRWRSAVPSPPSAIGLPNCPGRVEAAAHFADGDPGFGEQGIACLRFGRDEPDDVAAQEQDSTGRRVVLQQADAKLARRAVHRTDNGGENPPAPAASLTRASPTVSETAWWSLTVTRAGRVANSECQGRSAERAATMPLRSSSLA